MLDHTRLWPSASASAPHILLLARARQIERRSIVVGLGRLVGGEQDRSRCWLWWSRLHLRGFGESCRRGPACCLGKVVGVVAGKGWWGRYLRRSSGSVNGRRCSIVLAGGGASDDPEGDIVLDEVKTAASGDRNIFILLLPNDAHRTINALQRAATIVLQKSLREGFGLTVTEALWKGKPVIGGNTGGIKLQLINGQTGFVVNSPEEAAERMHYLLHNPEECQLLGSKGREYVREKFLLTRHLKDYLTLILSLISENSSK